MTTDPASGAHASAVLEEHRTPDDEDRRLVDQQSCTLRGEPIGMLVTGDSDERAEFTPYWVIRDGHGNEDRICEACAGWLEDITPLLVDHLAAALQAPTGATNDEVASLVGEVQVPEAAVEAVRRRSSSRAYIEPGWTHEEWARSVLADAWPAIIAAFRAQVVPDSRADADVETPLPAGGRPVVWPAGKVSYCSDHPRAVAARRAMNLGVSETDILTDIDAVDPVRLLLTSRNRLAAALHEARHPNGRRWEDLAVAEKAEALAEADVVAAALRAAEVQSTRGS